MDQLGRMHCVWAVDCLGLDLDTDLDNFRNRYFKLYLGDYGFLEHGPVVDKLIAWCHFVCDWIKGTASVGDVEQCC